MRFPREFQDHDCGCAWKSDPVERLCWHCKQMREDRDAEIAERNECGVDE